MNTYEGLFIVKPDLKDEDAKNVCKAVIEMITKNGGATKKEEDWGKRQLGYRIKKTREGRYFKVEFEAPASAIAKMEAVYRLNGDLLRVMITRKTAQTRVSDGGQPQ